MKLTQLVSDTAQIEGFLRHREQLPDKGDEVERDFGVAMRRKAMEAFVQASRTQAEIQAIMERLEKLQCIGPPSRDEIIRKALIRHARENMLAIKLQLNTASETLKVAAKEVSETQSPRRLEASPVSVDVPIKRDVEDSIREDNMNFECVGLDQ